VIVGADATDLERRLRDVWDGGLHTGETAQDVFGAIDRAEIAARKERLRFATARPSIRPGWPPLRRCARRLRERWHREPYHCGKDQRAKSHIGCTQHKAPHIGAARRGAAE
jgi:hypothetical protein